MNRKHYTGEQIGRLRVLAIVDQGDRICKCNCGIIKQISRTSRARSCGCLKIETAGARLRAVQPVGQRAAAVKNYKHGHCCNNKNSPEYVSYLAAQARCNNPSDDHWLDYGGRGIEFRFSSFIDFLNEVGERPTPKSFYSIGRIDNNGHYEISNIRWETDIQQNRNRRKYKRG